MACKAEWNKFVIEIIENSVLVRYEQPDGSGWLGKTWAFNDVLAAMRFIGEKIVEKPQLPEA